jgi:preprotein translocase subunit YajC
VPPEILLLVIVIALAGFWLIVLRPTRAAQERVAELQHELEIGDEVVITAGIFGTIRAVEEDRISLEIAPGTVISVARQVVVRRVPDPAPESKPEED